MFGPLLDIPAWVWGGAAIFQVSRARSIDSLQKSAGELLCTPNEVKRRNSPGARDPILSAGGESCWFS